MIDQERHGIIKSHTSWNKVCWDFSLPFVFKCDMAHACNFLSPFANFWVQIVCCKPGDLSSLANEVAGKIHMYFHFCTDIAKDVFFPYFLMLHGIYVYNHLSSWLYGEGLLIWWYFSIIGMSNYNIQWSNKINVWCFCSSTLLTSLVEF